MNLRPPRPERGALPDCATLRLMAGLITPASLKASLREAMTAEPGTRDFNMPIDKAIEAAARCLAAGGLVAFPDRDRLRARRRRRQWRGRCAPLCGQGPAGLQSVDRPRRRTSTPRAAPASSRAAEKLAAAFWPGPLTLVLRKAARLPRRRSCAGRARHRRGARARASGRARVARRLRRTDRRALGQPLRPCVADKRRACARRFARPDRPHRRCRPMQGRRGVDDRRPAPASPRCCVPAGCRATRSSACSAQPLANRLDRRRGAAAPGMLASHYAPKALLRLDADGARTGRSAARFRRRRRHFSGATLNLSPRGDLIEAAANLFSHLRALDASGAKRIAVMKVPHDGLGEAINDRLKRAARTATRIASE